jgi:hypothetical protein
MTKPLFAASLLLLLLAAPADAQDRIDPVPATRVDPISPVPIIQPLPNMQPIQSAPNISTQAFTAAPVAAAAGGGGGGPPEAPHAHVHVHHHLTCQDLNHPEICPWDTPNVIDCYCP